jgi:hypothetical protein
VFNVNPLLSYPLLSAYAYLLGCIRRIYIHVLTKWKRLPSVSLMILTEQSFLFSGRYSSSPLWYSGRITGLPRSNHTFLIAVCLRSPKWMDYIHTISEAPRTVSTSSYRTRSINGSVRSSVINARAMCVFTYLRTCEHLGTTCLWLQRKGFGRCYFLFLTSDNQRSKMRSKAFRVLCSCKEPFVLPAIRLI